MVVSAAPVCRNAIRFGQFGGGTTSFEQVMSEAVRSDKGKNESAQGRKRL